MISILEAKKKIKNLVNSKMFVVEINANGCR